jgi:hypothetical protein
MEVVDQNTKPLHLSVESLTSIFPKGVSANLIVNGAIYIIGQSFGITWRISMAQVFPPNKLSASSVFDVVEPEAEPEAENQEVDVQVEESQPQSNPDPAGGAAVPQRKRRSAVNPA